MKALFVQLPVMEPSWDSVRANVPLAAANLVAWSLAKGALARDDFLLLDQDLADYGSDAAILDGIACAAEASMRDPAEPLLACFSLYAWNSERSAWIARRLKTLLPDVITVAGGPEIATETLDAISTAFDVIVEGEGEEAFRELVTDLASGRGHARHYAAHKPIELSELPDPYAIGVLSPGPDKQVYVESMRGCPSRCAYCAYGKRFDSVRRYPERRLFDAIERAARANARDFYLLDPSFQARPELAGTLARIASINRGDMRLHAEIRLESVDEEIAMLYAEAGVESVEVGLQSTNSAALKAVGRSFDQARFEQGAEFLKREGILVRTGIILGLPYDTYEDVIRTFDFLGMSGLGQETELYPLSVLPGTELRAREKEYGIERFDFPPWWAMSTKWLSGDGMADAVAAFEDSFDLEWGTFARPHFDETTRGFVSMIPIRDRGALERAVTSPSTLANSVTFVIDSDDEEQVHRLVRAAETMRAANPWSLYQLALYSNRRLPKARTVRRLVDAFANPDHYFERAHFWSGDPQKSWQTRVFFVTRDPSLAADALESGSPLEAAIVWSDAMTGEHPDADYLAEARPFAVFDRDALSADAMRDLVALYAEYRDLMLPAPDPLFPAR